MDSAPADDLADAVEDGGKGVVDGDVFGGVAFVVLGEGGEVHGVDVVGHALLDGGGGDVAVFVEGFAGDGFDAVQGGELVRSYVFGEGDLGGVLALDGCGGGRGEMYLDIDQALEVRVN